MSHSVCYSVGTTLCRGAVSRASAPLRLLFFFFLVRSLWCLGRACNRSQQPDDTMWERPEDEVVVVGGGTSALSTPLSGSGDNKSIDCPSPVGAKCKQIERDGEQNRLVSETDMLNGGTAATEMPLWLFPSIFHYDACQSQKHDMWWRMETTLSFGWNTTGEKSVLQKKKFFTVNSF